MSRRGLVTNGAHRVACGKSAISSLRTRRILTWLVPAGGLAVYLLLVPPVPDFAAQATRAAVFHKLGLITWWPGWFGGLELPTYSVISPALMATIGVATTGALAAAVSMVVAHQLLRGAMRPRAASLVFAATVLFNLFGGRITFLVGLAAAMLAIYALAHRRPWLAVMFTVASVLGSPLAGLFTGIVAGTVLLTDHDRRRVALFVGAAAGLSLGGLALLFHSPGIMPSPPGLILVALVGTSLVVVACRQAAVRTGAIVVAVGLVACLVIPNSVGDNLTRMVWLLAAPLIVGYGQRPHKLVAALAGLALIFPCVDVTMQLADAASPSASESYYQPLLAQLRPRLSTGPKGQRVEVVEPESKGAARFVGEAIPLARGWERQTDESDNPIFYNAGELTAVSYRTWLDQLAVAYVAVPSTKLDFASIDEASLIERGLPYLHLVWRNADWKLYQVANSAPLARNAEVVSMSGNRIQLSVPHPGPVPIQIRWSDQLVVLDGSKSAGLGVRADGCLSQNGQWTLLHAFRPGKYLLTSDFNLLPSDSEDGGVCPSNSP
jgi:hypothetical protein